MYGRHQSSNKCKILCQWKRSRRASLLLIFQIDLLQISLTIFPHCVTIIKFVLLESCFIKNIFCRNGFFPSFSLKVILGISRGCSCKSLNSGFSLWSGMQLQCDNNNNNRVILSFLVFANTFFLSFFSGKAEYIGHF